MGNKPDLRTRQVSCPIAPAQAQGARMVATRQCRQLRIKAGSQEVSATSGVADKGSLRMSAGEKPDLEGSLWLSATAEC